MLIHHGIQSLKCNLTPHLCHVCVVFSRVNIFICKIKIIIVVYMTMHIERDDDTNKIEWKRRSEKKWLFNREKCQKKYLNRIEDDWMVKYEWLMIFDICVIVRRLFMSKQKSEVANIMWLIYRHRLGRERRSSIMWVGKKSLKMTQLLTRRWSNPFRDSFGSL